MNQRRKLLISGTVMAVWHKPMVNSVVTPAHAQTSPVEPPPPPPPPPNPEDVCPMIVTGNVVFGPVSGSNTPPVCSVTFDVLSGMAGTPLTITSITNTMAADTTITYDSFGDVTDTTGSRVVWRGPATDAPFCTNFTVVNEVTFTVTATCAAAPDAGTFTQDFTLTQILA